MLKLRLSPILLGSRLIARFDERQGAWICVESGESWPVLELLDAETAGDTASN